MPYMKKLNRVVNVPDADVELYAMNGYSLYDNTPKRPDAKITEPFEAPDEGKPRRGRKPTGE